MSECIIERSVDLDVPEVDFGGGEDCHVAVDAGDVPEILPLEVASVTPPEDLHSKQVLATLNHEGGDVKLRGAHRVLRVPDLHAIHPAIVGRLDPIKPEED